MKLFPDENTDVLCKLAEMEDFTPSKVYSLVPSAKAKQISLFLELAEKAFVKDSGEMRAASGMAIKVDKAQSYSRQRTSGLTWPRKQLSSADGYSLDLRSQTEEKTNLLKTITSDVPPKRVDNNVTSIQFTNKIENKILELLSLGSSSAETEAEKIKKLFEKLKNDPLARSRLENLHAGRAFKYGNTHFGPKSWYRESPNVSKKFRTQTDRRNFVLA